MHRGSRIICLCHRLAQYLTILLLVTACGRPARSTAPANTSLPDVAGLSSEEVASLASLKKVDEYPLYTMDFTADYESLLSLSDVRNEMSELDPMGSLPWGCSLFASLADSNRALFGRNFDWEYSPALLLFTDPPGGFASVSMVDIAYLGFTGESARDILELPIDGRTALLHAPALPFDGLNEMGLAVGMAAVPSGGVPPDPDKETIGSLGLIRRMLDGAADVDKALSILTSYNIDFTGGPPLHYLLADASGNSVLVEYYQGRVVFLPNKEPWHLATNFLVSAAVPVPDGHCVRYDRIANRLRGTGGDLSPRNALDLLESVAQAETQWSIVYGLGTGEINLVMGRKYHAIRTLKLDERVMDPISSR